jgi:hypothetical protein
MNGTALGCRHLDATTQVARAWLAVAVSQPCSPGQKPLSLGLSNSDALVRSSDEEDLTPERPGRCVSSPRGMVPSNWQTLLHE